MWMIGYHDDGELIGIPQPHSFNFNGDNLLRPLISSTAPTTTNNAPFLSPIHGTHHLLALNHHQSIVAEQSKRELKSLNTQQEEVVNVVSTRWNPTPEQLAALEELYRGGTQTPSAEQIHHITAQLRQYGKIEGKNVFYWFQNHKARDRHKCRRHHNHHHRLLDSVSDQQYSDIEITERKESEASRTAFEQTRNWAFPTNCTTLAEGAAKAAVPEESITAARWVQFDEGELLQQRRSFTGSLWPMKSTHHQDLMKIFIAPAGDDILNTVVGSYYQADEATAAAAGGCGGSHHQTLQLFPLRSDKETADMSLAAMNPDFSTPYQFFEFLPLKH